jgi:AhpD family alkylhydroperoxidase
MTERLNYAQQSPAPYKKFLEFAGSLTTVTIDEKIHHLIDVRASQLNGCAFCVDMHVKLARMHGENELRLHHLAIWRESNLFSPKERAALAWTEVVTRMPEGGIPDDLYEYVGSELSEKEISDLTFALAAINGWNRLSVAFKSAPGSADIAFGVDKAGLF